MSDLQKKFLFELLKLTKDIEKKLVFIQSGLQGLLDSTNEIEGVNYEIENLA